MFLSSLGKILQSVRNVASELAAHLWIMDLKYQKCIDKFPEMMNKVVAQKDDLKQWGHMRDIDLPECDMEEVDIQLGNDVAEVFFPLETRKGKIGEPAAIKNVLGWVIHGKVAATHNEKVNAHVHYTQMSRGNLIGGTQTSMDKHENEMEKNSRCQRDCE